MKVFQTNFGQLRYHDLSGSLIPILFIHGLGCCGSMDYPTVASGSIQAHRRIIPDLLGSGFSDYSDDFPYTIESHASLLKSFVEDLQLEELVIYGHSMGGAIAIKLAEKLDKKVKLLLLSEANLDNGGGFFSKKIANYSYEDFIKFGYEELIRENIQNNNRLWAKGLSLTNPTAIFKESLSLVEGQFPTWRKILYKLPTAKVFIFGEHSLPDPDWERLQTEHIQVKIIPNAGHSMAWENPQGLSDVIYHSIEGR